MPAFAGVTLGALVGGLGDMNSSGVALEVIGVTGLTASFVMTQRTVAKLQAECNRGDLVVDSEGFTFAGEFGTYHQRWDGLIQVVARQDHLVLQRDPPSLMVLPSRCFAPGDFDRAVGLVRSARADSTATALAS